MARPQNVSQIGGREALTTLPLLIMVAQKEIPAASCTLISLKRQTCIRPALV